MDDRMGVGDALSVLFLPVVVAVMLLLLVTVPLLIAGDYTIH